MADGRGVSVELGDAVGAGALVGSTVATGKGADALVGSTVAMGDGTDVHEAKTMAKITAISVLVFMFSPMSQLEVKRRVWGYFVRSLYYYRIREANSQCCLKNSPCLSRQKDKSRLKLLYVNLW